MVQGKPAKLEHEPEEEEVSLLTGHMQEDVSATNQKPLLLGLLRVCLILPASLQCNCCFSLNLFLEGELMPGDGQSMVEEKFEELQAAKESPDIPEVDEDGKPLTKKARTALLRAAEKEKEKRLSAASDRIEPQVTALVNFCNC